MGTIGLSPQISGSGTDKIRQSPPLLGTTHPRQKIHTLFRHNPPEGRIQSAQLSTKVYTAKIGTTRPFSRIVYKKVDTIRRVSCETLRKNYATTTQTKQKSIFCFIWVFLSLALFVGVFRVFTSQAFASIGALGHRSLNAPSPLAPRLLRLLRSHAPHTHKQGIVGIG